MVPAAAEPLIEPLEGAVLVAEPLPVVSLPVDELLPVVPEVLSIDDEPLPIIALVSVHAPLVPCRHPVSVMLFDEPVALWSQLPEVPVVLGVDVDGSCVGVVLVPDCVPLVDPDCAARVTAKAHAMATLDAVVTTRFMW